jgi:DNA primase
MITKQTIERVKQEADIVDVVSAFLPLKKVGKQYKCKSPFTNERTPSFYAVPFDGKVNSNFFKCFSSGEAGGCVEFLMKVEHMTFPEAITWLADRYHIPVEHENTNVLPDDDPRFVLFGINNKAQIAYRHFFGQTKASESREAISFVQSRGYDYNWLAERGIGYCPRAFDLGAKFGLSDQMLMKSSIMGSSEYRKNYFQGRLTFPVHSMSGKIAGFTARAIHYNKESKFPKWLHSRSSEVFSKESLLFRAFDNKKFIVAADKGYLTEGPWDCLALELIGLTNVCANLGSEITSKAMSSASKLSLNWCGIFDGDAAGKKAGLKFISTALEYGIIPSIVFCPQGQDPDEMRMAIGPQATKKFIVENEWDCVTAFFHIMNYSQNLGFSEKRKVMNEASTVFSKMSDSSVRDMFYQRIEQITGVSYSSVKAAGLPKGEDLPEVPKAVSSREYLERKICGCLYTYFEHDLTVPIPETTVTMKVWERIATVATEEGLKFECEPYLVLNSVCERLAANDTGARLDIPVSVIDHIRVIDELALGVFIEKVIFDWYLVDAQGKEDYIEKSQAIKEAIRDLPKLEKQMRAARLKLKEQQG